MKEIAECSTLYWAHARKGRPTTDLGDDWGSNSQWRTEFRQDQVLDGRYHYNIGRESDEECGVDGAAAAELLRHRCFVKTEAASEDLWPYSLQDTELVLP